MTKSRIEDYCELIIRIKPALNGRKYLVLKLYDGYNMTSKPEYEPHDIDIFVGSDWQVIYETLKNLKRVFPDRKIEVILKRTFLNPGELLSISGYLTQVDFYAEITISPTFVLDSVPEKTVLQPVPWCRDVLEPAFETPLDMLHVIAHAIKHRNIREVEILSLAKRLNGLSDIDVRKFIYYVKKADLEEIVLLVLELVTHYAKYCFKLSIPDYVSFYRNAQLILRVFRRSSRSQVIYTLTKAILSNNLRRCLGSIDLTPILVLYVFNSLKSVLISRSKILFIRWLKIVLQHIYTSVCELIYELLYTIYGIVVHHKFRIL